VFEAHRLLYHSGYGSGLKDLLGPVTRVKKKKKRCGVHNLFGLGLLEDQHLVQVAPAAI